MKTIKLFLIILLSMGVYAHSVGPSSYMPKKINYQGKIEIDGEAYTGTKSFNFKLFDALTGPSEIWDSGPVVLDVANGVFSAVLSGGTPTLSTATFSGERWLEIAVGGVTLTPREEIVPPPFAMVAAGVTPDVILPAGQLEGGLPAIDGSNLTGVFVSPGNVTAGSLGANVIVSSLAPNAVRDASIVSMSASKLTGALPAISGAALTGLSGSDNLGNHTATEALTMGAFAINSSSNITAAYYQINGSTVLAILPGTGSLGIGEDTGRVNDATEGNYNLFVGQGAGYSNTAGNNNSFVGFNAGYSNIGGTGINAGTGDSNSFFGKEAGYSNTTGSDNSFFGDNAGYANISGGNNTFVGSKAGDANIGGGMGVGIMNSFFGSHAGTDNTVGSYNTFLGGYAASKNTTGSENTYIGYNVGYNNETGSANSIVGKYAGFGASGQSFSSSTIMGYQAGQLLTAGSDNILFGFQAGDNLTTGSGNIIIGYDVDASAVDVSNELNIGGAIKGDLSTGEVTIGKYTTEAIAPTWPSYYSLTSSDFGKTITVVNPSQQDFTLPSVSATDIGAQITFVKLGAGNIVIWADSGDTVGGGSNVKAVNMTVETPVSVTLRLVTETMWIMLYKEGTWAYEET